MPPDPMKKFYLLFLILFSYSAVFANHITGGEMYYVLINQSGNDYTYRVTLKLYRDCNAPAGSADLDPSAAIAVFSNATSAQVWTNVISLTTRTTQQIGD